MSLRHHRALLRLGSRVLQNELSANLEQALAELPEIYRWAVLLADVEELPYQEIARVMDCPIGTVMSRINRGRKTLARLLRAAQPRRTTEPNEAIDKATRYR